MRELPEDTRQLQAAARGSLERPTTTAGNPGRDQLAAEGLTTGDKLESPVEDLLAWEENLEETRREKKFSGT